MNRFHLPGRHADSGRLTLSGEEARHAIQVLRVRSGEPVAVMNGSGGVWHCRVDAIQKRDLQLEIDSVTHHPPDSIQVTLAAAITKGKSFDLILQKATELGVQRIVPIVTDRVIARPDGKDGESKRRRWQQTVVEAMKQSGNPWLPKMEAPLDIQSVLNWYRNTGAPGVVAALTGDAVPIASVASRISPGPDGAPSVWAWTGPEGDFTQAEMQSLTEAGVLPVTLGPRVLRSETATVVLVALLRHLLETQLNGVEPGL